MMMLFKSIWTEQCCDINVDAADDYNADGTTSVGGGGGEYVSFMFAKTNFR